MGIHHGMSLRDGLRAAKNLGASVEEVRGTDELRVTFPREFRPVTLKSTRKDAPRVLTTQLMRAHKMNEEDKDAQASVAASHAKTNGHGKIDPLARLLVEDAPMPKREAPPAPVRVAPTPKKDGISASIETVTPAIAKEWLELADLAAATGEFRNRGKKQSFINMLALEIKAGRWDPSNGETIKLTRDGYPVDGQERLLAIVAAGVAVQVLVVRNVPKESFRTIDSGTARRGHDVLHSAGEKDTHALSSGLNMLMRFIDARTFETGARPSDTGRKPIKTPSGALLDLLAAHPDMRLSTTAYKTCNAGRNPAKLTPGPGILAHYVFSRVDPPKANEFYRLLRYGAGMEGDHPVWRLREFILNKRAKADTYEVFEPLELLAVMFKAWNAWAAGRKVQQFKWNSNEEFPGVAGLDWKKHGL